MNNQFNDQKEYLTSLKHEISLLQQQVDYLIRNEKAIGLLDLDVLMNRTHTIYDQLCSINVGAPATDDEDIDIDPNMLSALLGSEELGVRSEEELPHKGYTSVEETENEEEMLEEESEPKEEILPEEESLEEEPLNVTETQSEGQTQPDEDYGFIFKMEPMDAEPNIGEEQPVHEEASTIEEELGEEEHSEENSVEEEFVEEEPIEEENPINEDLFKETNGVIDFGEEIPEKKNNVYTTGDEIEMVIPHFDFPTIEDHEEEIPEEVPEEEVQEEEASEEEIPEEEQTEAILEEEEPEDEVFNEEEPIEERVSDDETTAEALPEEETTIETKVEEETKEEPNDDFQYEPIIFGNMEENEEVGFEIETPETLGERMQHEEDHSLAAKLQHQSVRSLRSAIGINDKFLLVNELFSGSMEKYNRSIENLDDVKTLNGALIYLNELRIELQWNSNNEAYKKLLDLVHRKFES